MAGGDYVILHAFLVALIVPPPNLILVALAGFALLRARPRLGRFMLGAALSAMLALSLPAVAQALLIPLEWGLPRAPPPDAPPRAIVILSAEVDRVRGPGPRVRVGPLTLQRLAAGVALARRTGLPVLVTGGRLGGRRMPPIAALMATVMRQAFQLAPRWVEPRAATTWQNAEFSAAILRPQGITSVWVVTDAWHERRALLAFRHFGLIATPAPVEWDTDAGGWLPSVRAWTTSYFAFHEWIGLVDYSLKAWLAGPPPAIAASNKAA